MKRTAGEVASTSRLRPLDAVILAGFGVRTRTLRSVLSAIGIAIGVATIVAVLGISQSSSAQLIDQLNRLGTNLLTVTPSSLFGDSPPTLPATSPAMVQRIGPVQAASAVGDVTANIYRNDRIDPANTDAITVYAALPNLLTTLQGHPAQGRFLDAATDRYPTVVLGATTAQTLGIDRTDGTAQLWLAHRWFTVIGILEPVPLAPELDRTALISFPIAASIAHHTPPPAEIYVRVNPDNVDPVESVLAATVNPAQPQNVSIARPSDALAARAAAKTTFQGLFLALGGLALAVGGIGIANMMVLGVLERRTEIGLRRALGATKQHIATQFLTEAMLISLTGGTAGILIGSLTTATYATLRHWQIVIPPTAIITGITVSATVGTLAGIYPATRAARLAPTDALRTV
jgi:putative ABC transport system permease protein